ncbi:hypothetical protein R84B8_01264 [Treponema sp. R8-4-B8]
MKKMLIVFLTAFCALAFACVTKPAQNPGVGPKLTVVIPELFSPDPDTVDDETTIAIKVDHPVPIKGWTILIQPNRQPAAQTGQQPAAGQPATQASQQPAATPQQGTNQPRVREPFYQHEGKGVPPKEWKWNGKSSRASGEMVQSATDYKFTLTVTDSFDNSSTYEGIISVDILVKRDGDVLRMVVPSIIFPPNAADFKLLSDSDMRSNRRVLNLIGRALTRFSDYKITIEGHSNPTTPVGPQRDNEEKNDLKPLSQKRAQAVLDYLSASDFQYKVDKSRLTAVGMGGTRTVASYDDSDENWKNRRVEFILRK